MQNIYNMQINKRTAIRKSRKSRKIRRFTKRRIVKGGRDNIQTIKNDNEFKKTIHLYQQEQRDEAIRQEIMLRRAEAEERRIAEERQIAEERRIAEERQRNRPSAMDALMALP